MPASRRKNYYLGRKSSFKGFECTFKSTERTFKSTERAFKSFERKFYREVCSFSSQGRQKGVEGENLFDRQRSMLASGSAEKSFCLERQVVLGASETFLYFCHKNGEDRLHLGKTSKHV